MSKNTKVTYELRFVEQGVSDVLRNGELIGSYNSAENVITTTDGFDKFHNAVRRFIKSGPVIQPPAAPPVSPRDRDIALVDALAMEGSEPPPAPVKANEKITGKQGPRGEVPGYPNAPRCGSAGDKDPVFIEWMFKHHPKDAVKRYENRIIERA